MNQPLLNSRSNAPRMVVSTHDRSIGKILMDAGRLKQENAERIARFQKERGVRFGEAALKLRLLSKQDIQFALARQFEYPYLEKQDGDFSKELVAAYEPFSPQSEALRSLRNQLLLRKFSVEYKTRVVISPERGEGRSYVAANLAVAFAQLGGNTLLIDADLRNPRQHNIFNLNNGIGLSTVLSGRMGAETIQNVPFFMNLSVLTAGPIPPNPLELLSRAAFGQLMHELSNHYDAILIDTPAGEYNADAQAIMAQAAAAYATALVVVRKNTTHLARAKNFLKRIRAANVEVAGAVFNQF
ncbi:MAG: chain length determinant protein tyrosine kinase EpsG [Pseudomonadota bacterium]